MCRFLVYTGLRRPMLMANLLTYPTHSIISQSYDARLRGNVPAPSLNGDGFGVGWYVENDPTPCIFTSIAPAWNNRNLMRLADKITSSLFFAHVRAASPGSPTNESNCHPFQFENLMWMHNGSIAEFNRIKRLLVNYLSDEIYGLLQGTTDTEHCFLLFLQILFTLYKEYKLDSGEEEEGEQAHDENDPHNELNHHIDSADSCSDPPSTHDQFHFSNMTVHSPNKSATYPPELLRKAMEETIRKLNEFAERMKVRTSSVLNFCVTDGQTVVVTRYTNFADSFAASLFFSSGSSFERDRSTRGSNIFRMIQTDKRQLCHIVSSEPLTDDPNDWIEVPKNHLVLITPQSNLLLFPIPFASNYHIPSQPSSPIS